MIIYNLLFTISTLHIQHYTLHTNHQSPITNMQTILNKLFDHQSLTRSEAAEIMTNIGAGKYNEAQIASFITVYLMRSIELEEIIGFRDALLAMAIKPDLSAYELIDIVGTGGDGKNTFNISTLSSLVVAGAGYKVAKHGNYGATSISGASNVLEYFGAKFTADESVLQKSLEVSNFAFLHAPVFNPAMKNVAVARKNLAVRTFFNVLGPLINPAQPQYQCLGVYNLKMMRLYNYVYQSLGVRYSIVHSLDGFDEISLTDTTKLVNNQGEFVYSAAQLGFDAVTQDSLSGGNSLEDAAKIFTQVLKNEALPEQMNVVIANAAVAIRTINPEKSLEECREEARESLESGATRKGFEGYLMVNNEELITKN